MNSFFFSFKAGGIAYRFSIFILFQLLLSTAVPFTGICQYYKDVINTLSSPSFNGRGYYKKGDHIAAKFIAEEFRKNGLKEFGDSYYQAFSFPVNTFPRKMQVTLNNQKLIPGKDFIVSPSCPAIKGRYDIYAVKHPIPDFNEPKYKDAFLLIDDSEADSVARLALKTLINNPPAVKGFIVSESSKLTWSVSQTVNKLAVIRVLKEAIPENLNEIILNINSKLIDNYSTSNVVGYIPGSLYPDSFIVFTAHYDHLGRMGKQALFAGANDNASGTAMIMDLAKHYSSNGNRSDKSIVFIAFAGEEAGLVGSEYFTKNPLFPLDQINFLINLDLMGNGSEGVMVVNGTLHENVFSLLEEINTEKALVPTIGKRGTAKNSDHYWFTENGVPAFFLYTMGGSKAYHDIYDTPEQLPLTEFEDIMTLLKEFIKKL